VGPTSRRSFRENLEQDFAKASNTAWIFIVLLFLHSMHGKIETVVLRSVVGTDSACSGQNTLASWNQRLQIPFSRATKARVTKIFAQHVTLIRREAEHEASSAVV
jgi:hypothetical protein